MTKDRRREITIAAGCVACIGIGLLCGSSMSTGLAFGLWAALMAMQAGMIICLGIVVAYDARTYLRELDEIDRRLAAKVREMSPKMAMLEREFLVPENRLH